MITCLLCGASTDDDPDDDALMAFYYSHNEGGWVHIRTEICIVYLRKRLDGAESAIAELVRRTPE